MSQPIDVSLSPEEILAEVRKFIPESVKQCQRTNCHEVTVGALVLLRNLPAAREAVLEYLSKVFFVAVNRQIRHVEMHPNSPLVDESIMNVTVPQIHKALIEIVSCNSQAWAPLVASWSLDLLGKLSWRYSKRANLLPDSGINAYLKYWLSFKSTRILVDLSARCIKYLSDTEAESCMNVLTQSIADYSPYFDWVVAHIGSCFPQLIIKKVLLWGLKDFSITGVKNSQNVLLTSVKEILGHLAGSHFYEIKDALLDLFRWSLNENINDDDLTRRQKVATVPYLLKLASLSQLLLKVITTVVLQTLFPVRPDVIPRLALFATDWCSYFDNQPEVLINLTVHLALACEQEAWQIISILLDTSLNTSNVGYHGVNAALTVKNVCREILEMILQEIDLLMRMNGTHNAGIALMTSIKQDLSLVVPLLLDPQPLRVQTAVRLISLLGAQSPNVIISAASFALRNSKDDFHLAAFVRLVAENIVIFPVIKPEPENPLSGHGYFTQTLDQALRDIQYTSEEKDTEARQLFKNLSLLLKWEKTDRAVILKSKLISRGLHSNLEQIATLMMKCEDTELAHDIAKTLDLLHTTEQSTYIYSLDLTLKLTRAVIRYFFICIAENSIIKKQRGAKIAHRLITWITSRFPCARVLAIRELVENSIYGEPGKYFGAKVKPDELVKDFSLLHQNHKHGTSVMLAQRHSSVFHAGIIGEGPRRSVPENNFDKDTIDFNSLLLLDAIKACCTNEGLSHYPNLDAMTMVSLLLVELVSPDVMYNGLPWPDEEFTKVTVERDLQIRRWFKDIPLLWTLLELTARHRPALTYCSVLLRAIAATVIANWDIKEGTRLVNVMALGKLLPTPLNCLSDVLPILTPNQINTVMKECVWAYMHENVPSPALFTLNEGASIGWRDEDQDPAATPIIRFTNTLRLFLIANIGKTGMVYATFFYNDNTS
ncbi:integrator complex subunit 5 [Microplitis demolitor]|uniref:integrator complex subunit 5 n=1 Tax=Microplitis demolitor TaxID=69319 RepID=UPI0004CD4263|nr:integrator complex subunit 5 [Microplitis demolitor]